MRYLWYSMYAFVTALAVYTLFFNPARRTTTPEPVTPVAVDPLDVDPAPPGDVQIALLLDTSSSMDGLIAQARTQLWEIVAEMQVGDNDESRNVSVALYQYGNNRLSSQSGFIERLSELTSDLDTVSVKLHALTTSGGQEHAPEAILRATQELEWSEEDQVVRVIVIAGNEGFAQGPVALEEAIQAAQQRGIKVVPIFCANGGTTSTGLSSWKRAATVAGTPLETIDPDQVVAKVETPYDAEIVAKYRELEATRIPYGSAPVRERVAQIKGSANSLAAAAPMGAQADRAVAQARQKVDYDLLSKEGEVDYSSLRKDALPESLQGKSQQEVRQEIEALKAKRRSVESEIQELAAKREAHLQSSIPASKGSSHSLGSSVRKSLQTY